jgi:hypothetical protein
MHFGEPWYKMGYSHDDGVGSGVNTRSTVGTVIETS